MPIMTIDCECDMIENNLSMIQLIKEEKIRKANEIVVYGKYLPTEIWKLIKDYAGINIYGRWDLMYRMGRRNAVRALEQQRIYDNAFKENQERQRLQLQAIENQHRQHRIEAERQQQQRQPKRTIWRGDANLAEELQQLLQVVRVGDMVFYQKKGMMPCAGRVSKVNPKSIRVTLKNGEDNLIKTVFSILTPGSEKDRRVRQLFSYNF